MFIVVYSPADRLYLLYCIGCETKVEDVCTFQNFTCGPGNIIKGESGIAVLSSADLISWKHRSHVIEGDDSKTKVEFGCDQPFRTPAVPELSRSLAEIHGMLQLGDPAGISRLPFQLFLWRRDS